MMMMMMVMEHITLHPCTSKVTEENSSSPLKMKRSSLYLQVLVGAASLWGMTVLLLQLPGRLTDLQAWYLHVLPFYTLITVGNLPSLYCSHSTIIMRVTYYRAIWLQMLAAAYLTV